MTEKNKKQAKTNNSNRNNQRGNEVQLSDKDVEKIRAEMIKRMQNTNKATTQKASSQKSGSILSRINPFVIITTLLIGGLLLFSIFSSSSTGSSSRSLTEVVRGLNNNEYSQIVVQNDGSVIARENKYFILEESIDNSLVDESETVKFSSKDNDSLESIDIEKAQELLEEKDLLARIRSALNTSSEEIKEIIFLQDSTILVSGDDSKDYILDLNRDQFTSSLEEEGTKFSDLSIPFFETSVFAENISRESFFKRLDNESFANIIETENRLVAARSEENIGSYDIDWTPVISSFTDTLTNLGFDLSSEENTFEVVTANIPAGITLDAILTILTIVGFVILAFVIFRSVQSSGMGIMQFGQSKAKMFFGKKTDVTFKDVAGIDEAKEELNEIVEFLKHPNKFKKLGARIPKGVLMYGPPGTGKTLLARAIAGEAGVPFFHTSGSEFEEMLVGAGASRVRDLFSKAKKAAPALIFIDEIDAIARKRGTRIQSGTTEQTLNQILVEMDGFETNTNVIVIAATNRPDVLDKAILRPGRFDRQVRIEAPDKDGRTEILQIHAGNKPLAKSVDLEKVAKRTVGFTGADLENILNEAAIIAAKNNKKEIEPEDIDEAVSKVVLGPAKRSRKRTEDELKLVAYHEAGHAIVAKLTEGATPVDKISIVSRGSSGGVTMFIPEKDENIVSMKKLLASIRVSLGGRAAEEVVLGDISTGASNDIEKATQTARNMIKKYGMSKALGLVKYGQSQDSEYLGYHYGDDQDYSEDTAKVIDQEVRAIVENAYKDALNIIKKNRAKLDELANLLIENEVMEKEEFEKLFEGNEK